VSDDIIKQAMLGISTAYLTGMAHGSDNAEAKRLLAAAVAWHKRNEAEPLPSALLAILVAARRVC